MCYFVFFSAVNERIGGIHTRGTGAYCEALVVMVLVIHGSRISDARVASWESGKNSGINPTSCHGGRVGECGISVNYGGFLGGKRFVGLTNYIL